MGMRCGGGRSDTRRSGTRSVGFLAVALLAACGGGAGQPEAGREGREPAAASAPAVRSEGFVTTDDGVRLFHASLGDGPQAVVIPVALYLEKALAPLAGDERRLVFYDPRCRGRSDCSDLARVTLERQIADLEQLRAGLGIERMALIGWSGLGMETVQYALRHPDRVTRIVQVAPIPPSKALMDAHGDRRSERVDGAAMAALERRIADGDFEDDPRELCERYQELTLPSSFANPAHAARVPDPCRFENEWPANLWPYFGALLPSFGAWDLTAEMRDLAIPRLVIHGREDGIPLAGAEAWAASGNARLLVLSPAGHFPFLERPAEFFPAVDRFLDGEWPEGAR